jgi:hypothetical protein
MDAASADEEVDGVVGAGCESLAVAADALPAGAALGLRGTPGRPVRDGVVAREDLVESVGSPEADPTAPADPVLSAAASGIETTAEPTPSATASAPIRPMWRP